MVAHVRMNEEEQLTAIVYGDTFALYDETEFDEFIEPLRIRFKVNGINTDVFRGAKCLDAGCGGGRGSIFMAQNGAKEVNGVDLSPVNVESSKKRALQKDFKNLSFQHGSLMEIPFPDETFDIVWCNGVLHHTVDPDKGLTEITRVLKKGGHLWLYLYGSGGIYWYAMDWIRRILQGTDVRYCIYFLRLLGAPVRRIAEWIDDWYVPYLRRYTVADVVNRLNELGYEDTEALTGGTIYDTSQRRVEATSTERALMGEGDVRHFCTKAGSPRAQVCKLPDPPDGKGSPYEDSSEVTQFKAQFDEIDTRLQRLQSVRGHDVAAERILVARSVHTAVRDQLESPGPFDVGAIQERLLSVTHALDGLLSAR